MRILLAMLMIASFSAPAFAADDIKCSENPNSGIGIDPEYIGKQVAKASSCHEASRIVESCAAGSTLDTSTVPDAIALCDKLTGVLSKSDADLKHRMSTRCYSVCNPKTEGTMCISQQVFCQLDVSKFLNSVSESRH